jgi:hypothetical protein
MNELVDECMNERMSECVSELIMNESDSKRKTERKNVSMNESD